MVSSVRTPLSLAVAAVLLFNATALHAQDAPSLDSEPSAIPVIAWWAPGEIRSLEVSKGKRTFVNDSLFAEEITRILYEIHVLEETDTSYTVRWDALEYESPDDLPDFDVSEGLIERLEQEGLVIETTELGQFLRIANLDAVQAIMAEVIDALAAGDVDETALGQEGLEHLRRSFLSREFLEQSLFKEVTFFYGLHGFEYPVGETWEYAELLPNFLGGNPILARGESRIAEFDPDDGFFILENVLTADDHEMRHLMASLIGVDVSAPDGEISNLEMLMVDTNTYYVDFFSGWIYDLDRVRTMTVAFTENDIPMRTRNEDFLRMRLLD